MKTESSYSLSENYFLKKNEDEISISYLSSSDRIVLLPDQYEFLVDLLRGSSLKKTLECYKKKDRAKVTEFMKNLIELGALTSGTHTKIRGMIPISKSPHLRSIHFDITGLCNLRCTHCYQAEYLDVEQELSTEEIIRIADECSQISVLDVTLSGGEPFMRPDIFDIVECFEKRGVRLKGIVTNGTLIDDSLAKRIACIKSKPLILVRLEGFSKESHEYIRGTGTFAAALDGLQALIDAGVSVGVNTIIHRNNVNSLYNMYAWIKQKEIPFWRIGHARNIGNYRSNQHMFQVSDTIVESQLLRILKDYLEDCPETAPSSLQMEFVFRDQLLRYPMKQYDLKSEVCFYNLNGCCIKPNGIVTPCSLLYDIELGNLRSNSLSEIWYSSKMREFKKIAVDAVTEPKCKDCPALRYCGGGCRAGALFDAGSIYKIDPLACKRMLFFAREVYPMIEPTRQRILKKLASTTESTTSESEEICLK